MAEALLLKPSGSHRLSLPFGFGINAHETLAQDVVAQWTLRLEATDY